jgi:hypothetical protein
LLLEGVAVAGKKDNLSGGVQQHLKEEAHCDIRLLAMCFYGYDLTVLAIDPPPVICCCGHTALLHALVTEQYNSCPTVSNCGQVYISDVLEA